MSGKCNLLLSILYYLLHYLVWKTVPHRAKHPRQSDKSVFEKKLWGETNTDYKDWTDEKISINKNKQIYFSLFFLYWCFIQRWPITIRFGWKPIPSEARVTRDEVSGFPWHIVTAVWKTVPARAKHPCPSYKSVFEKKLWSETNTDYKDITDFVSHIAKRNTMGFHET